MGIYTISKDWSHFAMLKHGARMQRSPPVVDLSRPPRRPPNDAFTEAPSLAAYVELAIFEGVLAES